MNLDKYINGDSIKLEEMLSARDKRQFIQSKLIKQYSMPIVTFTLNIVGPVKVFTLSKQTYEEGVKLIKYQCSLSGFPIIHVHELKQKTGYECFFVLNENPNKIKDALCNLEINHPLGRLFDIDVIKPDMTKVSRTELNLPKRKCILCNNDAFICSRSRKHSVDEILNKECEIMHSFLSHKFAENISSIAIRSLLYEVNATPKPGLVDKNNSGSHNDMDIFTFENSALSLKEYFISIVECGIINYDKPLIELLPLIRPIGKKAEFTMFEATNGINTHKGIIFSLGIICTALGYMYGNNIEYNNDSITNICKAITKNLDTDFKAISNKNAKTNGEKLFAQYGIKGIRGEAINGFPSLFNISLPKFKELIGKGYSMNDAGIITLIYIIAFTEDTNIISRSSYDCMKEIQQNLIKLVCSDKPFEKNNYIKLISNMDKEFIDKNISPGGSADILALTYFIYLLNN